MPSFLATLTGKLIAGLVILALLFGLYIWSKWDDTAQPKQDARSANAAAETAKEVVETVIDNAADEATVDQLVASAVKRIDDAPTPEVAAIEARSAICAYPQYANEPGCRL